MTFITDLADQALILPLVVAIGLGLLLQGWRRGAAAWAVAVAATFGTVLVLKLTLLACPAGGLRTPSGHTAAAAVVVGGLAGLFLRRRGVILVLAALAAATVGATRLALGVHTPAEVLVGACAGLLGAGGLVKLAGPPPPSLNTGRIAALAVAVVVVFHGVHLSAEPHISFTAWRFAEWLGVCHAGRSGVLM